MDFFSALDKLPFFVKQEAAVKIAIKGNAHIRAVFDDLIAGVVAAFRQQRVRNTVGEIAVRRVVHFDQFHRCAEGFKAGFNGVHYWTRCAVPGVNHQLERREVFDVDITEQVINVSITQIDLLIAPNENRAVSKEKSPGFDFWKKPCLGLAEDFV